MRIIICAVFLNGLILAAPLLRAQDVQILMTGEFAFSYVTAQSGETWYGIYNDDNQFRLVRTKINVEAIHDGVARYVQRLQIGARFIGPQAEWQHPGIHVGAVQVRDRQRLPGPDPP